MGLFGVSLVRCHSSIDIERVSYARPAPDSLRLIFEHIDFALKLSQIELQIDISAGKTQFVWDLVDHRACRRFFRRSRFNAVLRDATVVAGTGNGGKHS